MQMRIAELRAVACAVGERHPIPKWAMCVPGMTQRASWTLGTLVHQASLSGFFILRRGTAPKKAYIYSAVYIVTPRSCRGRPKL